MNLTAHDIYSLHAVATFEMTSRYWSPWLNVLTRDEWVAYEYLRDMQYYYLAGPGSDLSASQGSVWTNSTLQLLKAGPNGENTQSMYWTFVHDMDILEILVALGLAIPNEPLPTDGTISFYN